MQDELKVGKVGVRDRLKLYAEECQKKKDIENREKFDTQKLDASMTDITRFDSPTRNRNKKSLLGESIGKIESPGVFQFSPEVDPLDTIKKNREKKAQMKTIKPGMALDANDDVSPAKSKRSMRPDMMRGRSFDEKDPPRRSSPPRINNMRPGMKRGSSFDDDGDAAEKPQNVKDAEEKKAKVTLANLLDQDSKATGKGKDTFQLKSFSALRNGYISSIDDLRPEAKPFSVQTKKERKKEADKVNTYNTLKGAWEAYEDTAQDKPDPGNLTPEEEVAEEKVIEVETAVNEDWQEYAEEATKVIQDNDGDDSDSDDEDEWDFWILEAKRLKAEAERKKVEEEAKKKAKAEAKAKSRKEKEAQRKRLEAEDGDIVEIAKRLKDEARKKKEGEEKHKAGAGAANSKAKGGNAEAKSTKNVGKNESDEHKSNGDLEGDSDSDDAIGSKAKNDSKAGKSKSTSKGDVDVDGSGNLSESRIDEERTQSREERRQKRKVAKAKDNSGEDMKEILVGTSEDVRRRQLAFSWYSMHSTPSRSEFKEKVAVLYVFSISPDDISPDDVDLLPWNATGSKVNISKMNALTRASLMMPKQ